MTGNIAYEFLRRHFILVPVHPLIWITAGLIAGVAAYHTDTRWLLFAAVLAGMGVGALCVGRYLFFSSVVPVLCVAGGLLLGWLRAGSQEWLYARACAAVSGSSCLQATIIDRTPASHRFMKECLTISDLSVRCDEQRQFCFARGRVQIYAARLPKVRIGDTIQLDDIKIKPPKKNGFGTYLMRNGVVGTLFAPRPDITIIHRPVWLIWRSIWEKRDAMLRQMKEELSPQSFALYAALFLGNRAVCRAELDRLTPAFQQWGIMHYLARSGLHLVIFAAVWTFLFRFLPIPLLLKQLALVLLAIVYALLSWTSLSFMRAFAVFLIYQACGMLRVPFHFLYSLTLVCFLVVLINPVQVLFLDFQLSFALTFALGWFNLLRRSERLS